ncbi:MAG: ABC transporter substrate-binding protein [Pseudomonadota bacterium]
MMITRPIRLSSLCAAFALASHPAIAAEQSIEKSEPEAQKTSSADPSEDVDPSEDAAELERVGEAISFAQSLTADATAALTNEEATEAERLAAFQAVLAKGMAIDFIGKFMLGTAGKEMTPAQSARFDEVFPNYITQLYAQQFSTILGKELQVVDARGISRRDVVVRSQFPRKDAAPINVDWRIRKLKSGELKAIDIIASGVSIMVVKRDEFSSFIKQNGLDALLDRLEQETIA